MSIVEIVEKISIIKVMLIPSTENLKIFMLGVNLNKFKLPCLRLMN